MPREYFRCAQCGPVADGHSASTDGRSHAAYGVKRTSPDTENHDKNGYAKLYDDNNIFMTNVDNDNSDTTYTNMRNMDE